MPKIDKVSSVVAHPSAVKREAATPRDKALDSLLKGLTLEKLGAMEHRKLKEINRDLSTLPGGRRILTFEIAFEEREGDRWNVYASAVGIELRKSQYFVYQGREIFGPFKLPKGFQLADLLKNTVEPKPRTAREKLIKELGNAIDTQLPELWGAKHVQMSYDSKDATWRTKKGGRLHKVETRDERFGWGKQSWMFDLRKRELWLEQIPGYSGDCWGPFKLPSGFDAKAIATLAQEPAVRDAPSRGFSDDDSYSGGRSVGGSDSGSRPARSRSVGGSGSGPSAAISLSDLLMHPWKADKVWEAGKTYRGGGGSSSG